MRFKFRRIPCALGRTRRDARERAGTSTTRTYSADASHNKLLGFEQTSASATGTASTSVTHQYDAAGNLQTDGLHHYHYDSQGRLQSSQTGQGPDAPTTRYAHNALGQRVFKTEPLYAAASGKQTDSTLDDEEADPEPPGLLQTLVDFFTRLWNPTKSEAEHLGWAYVYDEDGSLVGEYGMGGSQSAGQSQYLYLPTASGPIPIAAEIDGRLYAIHTDHLGTPRRLTQANGQAAWQWAYTPYGDEAPTLGAKRFTNETTHPTTGATNIPPVRFNLRYPGQYFDEESGLHYNYFRSYDPRTGRYTQTDPIGLDGGFNRFAYVGGNPLNSIDPFGLSRLTINYVNGRQQIFENPTAQELLEAIYSSPSDSIKLLQLSGHGSPQSQCISSGNNCTDEMLPNLDVFAGPKKVANLAKILKEKLSSGGSIYLEGCNNASGDDNIAKSISNILADVPIVGGNGYQLGYENHWLFGNSSSSVGWKKRYINGINR